MSQALVVVLNRAVDAVIEALSTQADWGLAGGSTAQYHHDLVADSAALAILDQAGLGVFSEESGLHHPDRPLLVVVDPVDGSTNASRGIPWWAVSMCVLDSEGPLAAVVAGPPLGYRFEAVRGLGASRDGAPIQPSGTSQIERAIIAFNGYPSSHYGWAQSRTFGAAALDLCAVACGMVDAFVDCGPNQLAPWDYLGGLLVCREAGATVLEAHGRELVVREPGLRRAVVAAGDGGLAERLAELRRLS